MRCGAGLPHRRAPVPAALLGALVLTAAGCGDGTDPDRTTAPDRGTHARAGLSCDADRTAFAARSTVERVGGRRTDDYVVTLTRSTEAGVLALVDGDTATAFADLEPLGVSAVAATAERGHAAGLAQLEALRHELCG